MRSWAKRGMSVFLASAMMFTTALSNANITLAEDVVTEETTQVLANMITVMEVTDKGDVPTKQNGDVVYVDSAEVDEKTGGRIDGTGEVTIAIEIANTESGLKPTEVVNAGIWDLSGSKWEDCVEEDYFRIIETDDNIFRTEYTVKTKAGLKNGSTYDITFATKSGTVKYTITLEIIAPTNSVTVLQGKKEFTNGSGIMVYSDHSYEFTTRLEPGGTTDNIVWSLHSDSSCEKGTELAEINQKGWLTAKSHGTAYLKAQPVSKKGVIRQDNCIIQVWIIQNNPATKLEFVDESGAVCTYMSAQAGNTFKMNYKADVKVAELGQATDVFKWESSNEKVATVDQSGNITCVAKGTTVITLTAENPDVKTSCTLNVYTPAETVSFGKAGYNVKIGQETEIVATEGPDTANDKITWSWVGTGDTPGEVELVPMNDGSELTNVQSVKVVGKKVGAVKLTATTESGKSATTTINVVNTVKATKVVLNSDNVEGALTNGQEVKVYNTKEITLTAALLGIDVTGAEVTSDDRVIWEVTGNENNAVEVTYSEGLGTTIKIKGAKPGNVVTVKATSSGNSEVCIECKVKVCVVADKVSFAEGLTGAVIPNEPFKLTPVLENALYGPSEEEIVKWESTDTTKAVVDADGTITGKAAGNTVIRAITTNGTVISYNLQVFNPSVMYFGNAPSDVVKTEIEAGRTATTRLTVKDSDAKTIGAPIRSLVWTSNNTDVATVDANGNVTAIRPGDATITVTCGTTGVATYDVVVYSNLSSNTSVVKVEGVGDAEFITGGVQIRFDDTVKLTVGDYVLKCAGEVKSAEDIPDGFDYGYAYSYTSDVITAGQYTFTIYGDGTYYRGSKQIRYNVAKKGINSSNITISDIADQTFTGSQIKPEIVVTDNGTVLEENKDYRLNWINNLNVGQATVDIIGINNYALTDATGTVKVTKTFNIIPAVIGKCEFTLSNAEFDYNGNAQTPNVMVKLGNYTLSNGNHYTIQYFNNINAGTGRVRITAVADKGFSGYKDVYFKIKKRDVSNSVSIALSQMSYTYDGKAKKPKVTITFMGQALKSSKDYKITYSKNKDAGTAKVTIKGLGNFEGTTVKEFTISKVNINNCKIGKISNKVYTGKSIKPTVKVKNGKTTLKNKNDYTVKYTNNKNAGTATITITGKKNFEGAVNITFNIVPKKVTLSSATSKDKGTSLVKWKEAKGAIGYEIQFCTSSKFKKGVVTFNAYNVKEFTASNLKSKKTYYVRVRAYQNAANPGAWSSVKKVKIK